MRGPTLRLICVNDVYLLDQLPRLRTLVRHHATIDPADLLLVTLAGDFLAPSLLSSLDRGAAMVDCLDAVPVTHVTFGNHEDDVPFEALQQRAREFRGVWLNTNLRDFPVPLPAHQRLALTAPGGRTVHVGLVGVVSADPSLYRPHPFGGLSIAPANVSAVAEAQRLLADGVSCVLALTHQSIADDRALAAQTDVRFPLIVGGHDHEAHLEVAHGAHIVKAGMDATHAAVVDLAWPDEPPPAGEPDLPAVTVRLEDVRTYEDDPCLRARVDHHLEKVRALKAATLMRLGAGELLSSVGTRWQQTSFGAMVCSRVRDALGADLCFLNGGGIRAQREHSGAFTYGDLEAELPFANEVVVVAMPGRVVRAAVAESRARAPTAWAAYLQVDDGVTVDATGVVTAVQGAPFEPERVYSVATVRLLLAGLDGLDALRTFAHEHPERVPPTDSGRELKTILVETFALGLWRSLGAFEAIDADGDGRVSPDDLRAAIARRDPEGASALLVEGLFRALDADGDAHISREEDQRRR
jgi:2',3'-cyclic-nucleotide 2'-phosphodiesterase (5'-nucleotidase family)